MEIKDFVEKIRNWEHEHGESFYDYFAHDRISNVSWAFWLIGKGYKEHGNAILEEHNKEGNTTHYVGQEELYNIYPEYVGRNQYGDPDFSDENYEKNLAIMAEFLVDTPIYTKRVMDWFKQYDEENVEE
jgi:hypothetical protein